MSETDREFAFGDNQLDGCECPAVTAGYDPVEDDDLLGFVEKYDDKARNQVGIIEGTISEEEAKQMWLDTLNYLREAAGGTESHYYRYADRGETIAEELGWTEGN